MPVSTGQSRFRQAISILLPLVVVAAFLGAFAPAAVQAACAAPLLTAAGVSTSTASPSMPVSGPSSRYVLRPQPVPVKDFPLVLTQGSRAWATGDAGAPTRRSPGRWCYHASLRRASSNSAQRTDDQRSDRGPAEHPGLGPQHRQRRHRPRATPAWMLDGLLDRVRLALAVSWRRRGRR